MTTPEVLTDEMWESMLQRAAQVPQVPYGRSLSAIAGLVPDRLPDQVPYSPSLAAAAATWYQQQQLGQTPASPHGWVAAGAMRPAVEELERAAQASPPPVEGMFGPAGEITFRATPMPPSPAMPPETMARVMAAKAQRMAEATQAAPPPPMLTPDVVTRVVRELRRANPMPPFVYTPREDMLDPQLAQQEAARYCEALRQAAGQIPNQYQPQPAPNPVAPPTPWEVARAKHMAHIEAERLANAVQPSQVRAAVYRGDPLGQIEAERLAAEQTNKMKQAVERAIRPEARPTPAPAPAPQRAALSTAQLLAMTPEQVTAWAEQELLAGASQEGGQR